jgi:ligand-binding SRPBCC domain-containing protein
MTRNYAESSDSAFCALGVSGAHDLMELRLKAPEDTRYSGENASMSESLKSNQWVPFPVELVFAFFANPGNLPHLTPKGQRAVVESSRLIAPPPRPLSFDPKLRFQSPAAGVGSEIVVSFRPVSWLRLRVRWQARIVEFAWNSHFCDEQVEGPFAAWRHCHRIMGESREGIAGTVVLDEVEYRLPLGTLGSLANAVFVRRQMEAMFAFRQKRLAEILPVAARQAERRS